ncbi:C-X-C motif chemokine 9-like [Cololabis saira]|uniref:C-X-C motif chemokine 9-like n=1 Tax=Cololabis saira TaxID=129043 RepID=UPI002AD27C95|nr:C-X-C motif chemokine 9-like [Cololabis saira]
MKFSPQFIRQLAFLSFCCLLTRVRESDSTFVPGRCLCPATRPGVRGQLKELTVYPKSPGCSNVTVIVKLERNDESVCLNPEGPMGKQLIRCWNRSTKLNRDVKLCLKRKRRRNGGRRQRPQQRRRVRSQKASSSDSQ